MTLVGSGCSQRSAPLDEEARRTADAFVTAVVVDRDADAAQRYSSPEIGDASHAIATLNKEGIYRRAKPGRILRGCDPGLQVIPLPEAPDCVIYELHGKRPLGQGDLNVYVDAELTVWLKRANGDWLVNATRYSAGGRVRPSSEDSAE